jgi:hypothetical protein
MNHNSRIPHEGRRRLSPLDERAFGQPAASNKRTFDFLRAAPVGTVLAHWRIAHLPLKG